MNTAKKAAAVFLACLMFLLPLTAYAENGAALRASAFESVNTVPGLTLTTDQKSYSLYSLVLMQRFQNKTRRGYDYGAEYYLEKYVDGQWRTFVDPDDVAYPALGYYLAAKGSAEHALTITDSTGFYRYHSQIEPGTYRIVQPLRDEQTKETVYLAAEFLVSVSYLYAKEPVYLRTGPSVNYGAIRELKLGERVSYIRKSGKWTLVRAGDQTGYVYAKYLAEDEQDCYYNHAAVKLLGTKRVQVTGVYSGKTSTWYLNTSVGRGNVLFDSDTLIFVHLKKPYQNLSMTIAVYPDDASAQKKFDEIAAEETRIPDVFYSYFLCGHSIIRWSTGGLVDWNRREQDFSNAFVEKLKALCSAFTS